MAHQTRKNTAFYLLLGLTAGVFFFLIWQVFMRTPAAQAEAGGLAQKIFYFHVPAAYGLYLSGVVSGLASSAYLLAPSRQRDAWASAGAEAAVLFGAMVLTSGPLWAKKAWGVYWEWDPRLTTTLLSMLVYSAVVLLRAFSAEGEAERRFAAAISVLGTFNLPIIHFAVKKWGAIHPDSVKLPLDMAFTLYVGFGAMTLLAFLLIWSRARVAAGSSRLARLEERLLTGAMD